MSMAPFKIASLLALLGLAVCTLRAASALSLFGGVQAAEQAQEAAGAHQLAALEAPQQAQQQQLAGSLAELAQAQLGASLNAYLPGTVQGLSSDLSNNYNQLSDAVRRYQAMLTPMGLISSGAEQLELARGRYTEMLLEQLAQRDQQLRQLAQLVAKPEQLCRQLIQQSSSGLEAANQQLSSQQQALSSSANSLINRLGGAFSLG